MWNSSPTDARTYEAAVRIARRCVGILRAVLRDEEVVEATRVFYQVARDELEKWKAAPPQG